MVRVGTYKKKGGRRQFLGVLFPFISRKRAPTIRTNPGGEKEENRTAFRSWLYRAYLKREQ